MAGRVWRALVSAAVAVPAVAVVGLPTAHATTDVYWSRQWAPLQIGAPAAWRLTTGAGLRIGVVDTGVDLEHEDLAGKIAASASCIGAAGSSSACRGTAQDDNGHGTAVSSIAAAVTDNGRGIAGVAPGATLVVARSLTDDGDGGALGAPGDVSAGIDWVVDQGARIVNLSLGTDVDHAVSPSPMAQVIERAWDRGAIPVVAAGNGPADRAGSRYAHLHAVVVGASRRDGSTAPYSASLRGSRWGLVAPGGAGGDPRNPGFLADNVVSATWVDGSPDSYGASGGTSIAAPHVSGALALLLAQGLTRQEAIGRLLGAADDSRPCGDGCHGRLDVGRAVVPVSGVAPAAGTGGGASTTGGQPRPEVDIPSDDAAVAQPEDGVDGGTPIPEPLPFDPPDGGASDRAVALLPEPGSSLRLSASPDSDAVVPRNLLLLVVSVTVVSSVLLEGMARRNRRGGVRSSGPPDDDAGGAMPLPQGQA